MIKQWVLGLTVLYTIVVYASASAQLQFGPGESRSGELLDNIVAVVNNDIITRKELDTAVNVSKRQLRGNPPPLDVLQRQALERLIMEKLQRSAAQREGIVVDDPSLNAAVESIARQNNMNLSQLRQTLLRDGIDYEAFRDDVRSQVAVGRLRQKVVNSQITVSDQEVNNAMRQFSASNQVAQDYRISQILVAVPEAASPTQIEAAQAKVRGISAQLAQGADFAQIAVSESDGREALDGGEIGWRSAAQLPSLFADVIVRLQPGEVTRAIRSPAGFHLIKLLDVRGANQAGANNDAVREALFRRKSDEEWELWLRRLRAEAYVEIR